MRLFTKLPKFGSKLQTTFFKNDLIIKDLEANIVWMSKLPSKLSKLQKIRVKITSYDGVVVWRSVPIYKYIGSHLSGLPKFIIIFIAEVLIQSKKSGRNLAW